MKLCECKVWCTWYEMIRHKQYNWITLDLCTLEFEYDRYGPLLSFKIGVLGFNFYISFNPSWETAQSKELKERSEDAKYAKYLYKFVKVPNPVYVKRSRKSGKRNKLPDNTMLD